MRKTKIICTIGPALDDDKILKEVAKEMDCARFNFSHGTHEEHLKRVNRVREISKVVNRPIAIMIDTKGPEIRTGLLKDHKKVLLKQGEEFTLTTKKILGDENIVSITYEGLYKDVKKGSNIYIDDGLIELVVKKVVGKDIICNIDTGGTLGERKGINLPHISTNLPDFSNEDIKDIEFAIKNKFDFIAVSFVRSAKCINKLRNKLEANNSKMKIIAKIENAEGFENLDEIMDAADGIMIARGDLGIEVEAEKVPAMQKDIIRRCNSKSKTVITATQMLNSMIENVRPTRAEINDVANAVYDGADCVMLSGETASGKHPIEAVKEMVKTVEFTENTIDYAIFNKEKEINNSDPFEENVIAKASVDIADAVNATCIVVPTTKGRTAKFVSKVKTKKPIYALTHDETTMRQMMLLFGVKPYMVNKCKTVVELIYNCGKKLKNEKVLKKGDTVVLLAGFSFQNRSTTATTNTIKIHVIE